MADKQDTQGTPCDVASCTAMMEKMMEQMDAACGCAEMMSQPKDQAGRGGCDCSEMMSQMMASGARRKTKRTSLLVPDPTHKHITT